MDIMDFKKAKMQAMKAKDHEAVQALEAIISKLMLETISLRAKGKELTDNDIVAVCQKVDRELAEEQQANQNAGRAEAAASLGKQREVVAAYLPKMLSKDEIRDIILSLEDKSVPFVMKYFKANYPTTADMRLVNEILRGL